MELVLTKPNATRDKKNLTSCEGNATMMTGHCHEYNFDTKIFSVLKMDTRNLSSLCTIQQVYYYRSHLYMFHMIIHIYIYIYMFKLLRYQVEKVPLSGN